jgi:hypothetical protein
MGIPGRGHGKVAFVLFWVSFFLKESEGECVCEREAEREILEAERDGGKELGGEREREREDESEHESERGGGRERERERRRRRKRENQRGN